MAKVGAQRAAELTGKSKSTIQRAMNTGKLSFEKDSNNRRIIDVSELERVYGLSGSAPTSSNSQSSVEAELKKATDMIEMERMKMKIKMLEDQLETTTTNMEDLRAQRDQWQKQAQQVLITSQYSQKQAEEYKTELKTREEAARKRREEREKIMAGRMNKMQGQNENRNNNEAGLKRPNTQKSAEKPGGQDRGRKLTEEKAKKHDLKELLDFQGLWQKIKGEKAA